MNSCFRVLVCVSVVFGCGPTARGPRPKGTEDFGTLKATPLQPSQPSQPARSVGGLQIQPLPRKSAFGAFWQLPWHGRRVFTVSG